MSTIGHVAPPSLSSMAPPAGEGFTEPALDLTEIAKRFGATIALKNASFTVHAGEVHALLGENGAGKSTLVKLLSGLLTPDAGRIRILGQDVALRSPRDAHDRGVQTAFQELTLVGDLTVTENMLAPYAPKGPLGQLRRRRGLEQVAAHLADMGLSHVDPRDLVSELELPLRQKIEIARALFRKPRILLLDEPTSTLSGNDIDWLGEHISILRARGVTVVFISHRMREVRQFCDRLTVLRNGESVGTATVGAISDDEVIRLIIGRSLASTFPARPSAPGSREPILRAETVAAGNKLHDASFTLHRGEILGVAALQGMGQADLFHACFGMEPLSAGKLFIDDQELLLTSPHDAISQRVGISLVPEDRKTEGLFLKLPGQFNVSLPVVDRFVRYGLIDTKAEADAVTDILEQVEVAPRALYEPASAFSGGNQQKLVIAKWLLADSRILLLFDPTRGVDVGTKHQIYVMMRDFVDAGGSILFYSTEIPEIVNMCDRVMILYQGRIVTTVAGDQIDEEVIMRAALNGVHVDSDAGGNR